MSLPLSPRKRLLVTEQLDDEVLNALLAAKQWELGEQDMMTIPSVNITASTRVVLLNFAPPEGNAEEWIVLLVQVRDTAQITTADQVQFQYLDSVGGAAVNWRVDAGLTLDQVAATFWTWPVTLSTGINPKLWEIRTRRKDNKELWRTLSIIYAANATVGTRVVNPFVIFQRRRI